jgi:predicted RNase H-like nuclease (RuvC/YqgF family)
MKSKKRLSTKELIELRSNRKLLLSKLEVFKKDFDFAERSKMSHTGLVHLYANEMQVLHHACSDYEKQCKILPSESDMSKTRLYEFNSICEQDLKRRNESIKEKGHSSNYISWNMLMLDTSISVLEKSLLEKPEVRQENIF